MAADFELKEHKDWLGNCQQVGLVVSPSALHAAEVVLNVRAAGPWQEIMRSLCRRVEGLTEAGSRWQWNNDPLALFTELLQWPLAFIAGAPGNDPHPEMPQVVLSEYRETLTPTYAIAHPAMGSEPPAQRWQMLIRWEDALPLDEVLEGDGLWHATPQARMERLLRDTGVPVGLLLNRSECRLVYAPHGETSGHLPFSFTALCETGGRPVLAAFLELLGRNRLFYLQPERRLPNLLAESRKHQNRVTVELSGQVLEALHELLRGLQTADDRKGGQLMRDAMAQAPDKVYGGLLTVILRLIFLLYAEERRLLYDTRKAKGGVAEALSRYYSVLAMFHRLRDDAGRFPDTMDSRYGAWAQLLSMFRLVYHGAKLGGVDLTARQGSLFDPDRFQFLEGRPWGMAHNKGERLDVPQIPDGTVYQVLKRLLILDGERLSYLSLDVEQIGSVYETMMGFRIEKASGASLGIRSAKGNGADPVLNLEELLGVPVSKRAKWFQDQTGLKLGKHKAGVEAAKEVAGLEAALTPLRSRSMPRRIPHGALVLQPTEERRRTGSHYTPRSLTEPIVQRTLDPVLKALGAHPRSEAILGLKVLDPAMGSGAFLVAACRYLADAVVDSWRRHGNTPRIAPDEDELTHARRLVAQNCLYGADVNRFAVELAKLSLWLATLARDHAFTFVDHGLKHGDSLVGLDLNQLLCFEWKPNLQAHQTHLFLSNLFDTRLAVAVDLRKRIEAADDTVPEGQMRLWFKESEEGLEDLRLIGDAVIAAWFSMEKDAAKEKGRLKNLEAVRLWLEGGPRDPVVANVAYLRDRDKPVFPFHWPLEFPEVFLRDRPGFDAVVGNPPFAGKNTLAKGNAPFYPKWLQNLHEKTHGNADLVAHFFRRLQLWLRPNGCFGFIATNTLSQGDTRQSGLTWLLEHDFNLYWAKKRQVWPTAATTVKTSVVNGIKGDLSGARVLNDRPVQIITAYLFHDGGNSRPRALMENSGKGFNGTYVLGMGFTFDDSKPEEASPISEMKRLLSLNPKNQEVIFPYIGGEEVNDDPEHQFHRYVINFNQRSLEEASKWPDLLKIVEEKVKPERLKKSESTAKAPWWQFLRTRPEMNGAIHELEKVIVCACIQPNWAVTFLDTKMVLSNKLSVFALNDFASFAFLQSRVHEIWARFFCSTMEDRLNYSPSDCFVNFPFPPNYLSNFTLQVAGQTYFEYRAQLMRRHNLGMTKLYNAFHSPVSDLDGIPRLRELHHAMDVAVLEAYGFEDLAQSASLQFEREFAEDPEVDESTTLAKQRLRWPEAFHDELLTRLLKLNAERAILYGTIDVVDEDDVDGEETGDAPQVEAPKKPKPDTPGSQGARGRPRKTSPVSDLPLFQGDEPLTLDL